MLCDTHAHLDFNDFEQDRDGVIERAHEAGVMCIINPGCDIETSKKAVHLSRTYRAVYAAVGIHPNSTHEAAPGDILEIARLASDPGVVAIGEIGLDFYRDRSPRDVQIRAFRSQLDLARTLDLPIIIHFRAVEYDGIERIGEHYFQGLRGVFHCFGGSVGFAEKVLSLGFYIGFDGPLTYRNSDRIDVAHFVPVERCLIETDAPFLTPQKYRDRRNEPAYVAEVAYKLAEIKAMDADEVIAATGRNACDLFGLHAETVPGKQ